MLFSLQVLDGLKTGNAALKRANEMFSIEEIEAIMDETEEAVEKQREIDALLSGQLSTEDEEAALEELDRMVAEADGDAVAEKEEERVPELPEAPTDELPKEKQRQKGILNSCHPIYPHLVVRTWCMRERW